MEGDLNIGTRLSSDEPFAYNTLIGVFKYLTFKDLLNCALVCPIWRWIVNDESLWKHITVYCCTKHIDKPIDSYGPKIRHLEILNPRYITEDHFKAICMKMGNLQRIALHGCRNNQLEVLAENNRKLERVHAEIYWGQAEFSSVRNLVDLTHLCISTHRSITDAYYLSNLKKLKHLSLFAPCEEPVWQEIVKIESLESLSVDTDIEATWINALFETNFFIRHLKNLKKLQITALPYFHEYDILDKIKLLPNIKELVLDDVSISRAGMSNFGSLLSQCRSIERFTISINRVVFYDSILDIALENFEILNGVSALKENLKYFCWFMDVSGISRVEQFYNQHNVTALKTSNNKRTLKTRYFIEGVMPITLSKLRTVFQRKLPNTEVHLVEFGTVKRRENKCCYKCNQMIMTTQDRMKSYS